MSNRSSVGAVTLIFQLALLGLGVTHDVRAQDTVPEREAPPQAATGDAVPAQPPEGTAAPEQEKPNLPWQVGPTHLSLPHEVQVDVPDGYRFLGQPQAGAIMEKMGNLYNDNLLGFVVSNNEEDNYFVTLRFDEEGYVKDDESIDADEILEAIQDGEEAYNEERKKAGFSPIHAEGWQEKPHYDKQKHRLVWGLTVRDDEGSSVNYSTRMLGRKGYVAVNLVTDPAHLAADKPKAAALLAATTFAQGARYEDFHEETDKVAEYGLSGLVLGGAGFGLVKVAKLGLLAKFSKVILAALLAGKKAIALLLVGAWVGIKKFLGRKKNEDVAAG